MPNGLPNGESVDLVIGQNWAARKLLADQPKFGTCIADLIIIVEAGYIYFIKSAVLLIDLAKIEMQTRKVFSMTNTLTDIELSDVRARVHQVQDYLKQATSAWLSIAYEVANAKAKLKPLAFQKFITDCGFTTPVADKLVKIGNCGALQLEENLPLVASVEGWTVLYELSKLEPKQITSLLMQLEDDPTIRLTREVIENFAASKPLADKRLVFATIEVDDSKLKMMTSEQFNAVKQRISDLEAEIDRINAGFVLKTRDKNVIKISSRAAANSEMMIVKTAA